MGVTRAWQFEADGVSKAMAVFLLLEFWSSRGYRVHTQEFNEIVLRVNGFGTLSKWLEDQGVAEGQQIPFHHLPMQLTARLLAKPQSTNLHLKFELPDRWSAGNGDGFSSSTRGWVGEFSAYVKAWRDDRSSSD